MFTVEMYKGRATDISHTGTSEDSMQITGIYSNLCATTRITSISTSIDATTNGYLRLHCRCGEEHHQTYYGIFSSQFFILYYQFTVIVGLSKSGSDSTYK